MHANKYICELEKENSNPVCIFEDDVEFLVDGKTISKTLEHLFFENSNIDAISLGALVHLCSKQVVSNTKILRIYSGGLNHGMIYSYSARNFLLKTPLTSRAHDLIVYSEMHVVSPRWPFAVQKHHRSDNSLTYDPTGLGTLVLHLLDAGNNPSKAYYLFHAIGHVGGTIPLLLVTLSAILAATFF